MMIDATTPTRKQRPAPRIKGPWAVAATLSLFLIVPTVTYALWAWVSPGFAESNDDATAAAGTLDFASRGTWPRNQFTTFKSLERGPMSAARTNQTYRDFGFHVAPGTQHALNRAAALAGDEASFTEGATREALETLAEQHPDLFYPRFLLGTWHRLQGDAAEAERHFTEAFDRAPAALVRRYTAGGSSQPAADAPVPTLAVGVDQVIDDELDRSVVLVYPFLQTDADGFVYLPVYKTILRLADPAAPSGFTPTEEKPQWFTFYGHVGRLSDAALP